MFADPHKKNEVEGLLNKFQGEIEGSAVERGELTLDIKAECLLDVCAGLRDEYAFDTLIDVCGVDYLHYGLSEWETQSTTSTGFSRAVSGFHFDEFSECAPEMPEKKTLWSKPRFGVVYHLLSVSENKRLRLRVFLQEESLEIDSVTSIWASANWFEREAFDLIGIRFRGHPDLRRILTDYGFVGHPFRKDFPLVGHVEMRYDAKTQTCVYEPVSIQSRVTVPKVIRRDHRYAGRVDAVNTP